MNAAPLRLAACFLLVAMGSTPSKADFTSKHTNPKNGTIRGHVVAADTGSGLNRATITVVSQSGDADDSRVVTTSENGDFQIDGLKPDKYWLSASRNGYLTQFYGQKSITTFAERSGTPLDVREGETLSDISFRLIRGGVIEGKVVDVLGEPTARVVVQLSQYRRFKGQRLLVAVGRSSMAQTDDRGYFRLFEIPPGTYYLSAARRSFVQVAEGNRTAQPPTYYPGVLDPMEATALEVVAGRELQGIELTMLEVRGFNITGRVVAPGGALGRELYLWARRFSSDGSPGSFFINGRVEPTGRFTLRNAIPGKYVVAARSDEFDSSVSKAGILSGSRQIELTDADLTEVNIILGYGGEISGRVEFLSDSQLLDPKKIHIEVSPDGDSEGFYRGQGGEVANDFSFSLKGISEGRVRLQVKLPSGRHYIRSILVEDKDVTDQSFDIRNNDHLQVVVTVSKDGAEIQGTAKTEDPDVPAKGVTVLV